MKSLNNLVIITLAIILFSAQSIQAASPTPLHVNGPYKHKGSEMVFSEIIGKFERVQITQFAPEEKDVGIGYNLYNPAPIAATVYIYPATDVTSVGSSAETIEAPRMLAFQKHLNEVKGEIMAAHPDAKLISDDDFTLVMGEQSHKGRKVTYEFGYSFGSGRQDSISQLFLFQNKNWLIKYRITFPKTAAFISEAAVVEFINKLVWP